MWTSLTPGPARGEAVGPTWTTVSPTTSTTPGRKMAPVPSQGTTTSAR
jgi:hypothetical protein